MPARRIGGRNERLAASGLVACLMALVAAAVACSSEADGEAVRLRFGYQQGDTLHYEYRAAGTVTFPDSIGENEGKTHEYERRMRIREVAREITPRDHIVLELTYYPGEKKSGADSTGHKGRTRAGEPIPDEVTLDLEITPQGRIVRVTGVDDARQLFGDLDFQSMFEQSQPVFPERPLEPGDSWTQEVKVLSPTREPVVTSSTYVLDSLAEDGGEAIAVISFDGDVYLPVTFDPETSKGGLRYVEQEIRLYGTIRFAYRRGIMRRVHHTADGTLSRVSLRGGKPVRESTRVEQETTIRLVEGP